MEIYYPTGRIGPWGSVARQGFHDCCCSSRAAACWPSGPRAGRTCEGGEAAATGGVASPWGTWGRPRCGVFSRPGRRLQPRPSVAGGREREGWPDWCTPRPCGAPPCRVLVLHDGFGTRWSPEIIKICKKKKHFRFSFVLVIFILKSANSSFKVHAASFDQIFEFLLFAFDSYHKITLDWFIFWTLRPTLI